MQPYDSNKVAPTRRDLLKAGTRLAAGAFAGGSLSASAVQHKPDDEALTVVEPFRIADEAAFFAMLDYASPEMEATKSAATTKNWPAAKRAWSDHIKAQFDSRWFWSLRDRETIGRLLAEKKQPLSRWEQSANNVLERKFVLVGVPMTLDKSPSWSLGANDWTSVLNRFSYFNDLGYAWWATGDHKYAEDFVFLLKDWIAKNPVPEDVTTFGTYGSPWRALEDGIRVQNWLNAFQLFRDAPAFDAEAVYQMTKSLAEHTRYLRAVDIRRGYRGGNWQVMEATGSAFIALMLPEFKESASWRERAFYTLAQHMQRDVYPDGAQHELTPGYHMAVTDQYLQISLLSQKNGFKPTGLLDRHEKMYEFLEKLCKPDRIQPSIADSGKQPLEGRMADGALLYGRRDFRFFGPAEGPANWVWTFGPSAFARYDRMTGQRPEFTSVLLPDAQYAMMRTGWDVSDSYVLFDMAPWGGGHSHQDRLQVIAYAGRDLLIDPGQYGYDQPLASTYFRKSEAHNVLMVDGAEQPDSNPTLLAWEPAADMDFASGSISAKGLTHQRSVLFLKADDVTVIVDHVQRTGAGADTEHEVTRLFHFAPTTVTAEDNVARSGFSDGKNMQIQSLGAAKLEIRKGWVAIGGAKAEEAPVAAFVTKAKLPRTLITVLTAYADASKLPKAEATGSDNPSIARIRLTFADGKQTVIAIADTERELQIGAVKKRGRVLVGPER